MNDQCNCAETAPTYPVYRDTPHLPGCPVELREAALAVLPMLDKAREFMPFGSEEARACARLRRALSALPQAPSHEANSV